ncbi:molybdopterin-dependent oxidoreductase [Magnetovibrio sp.]|uniref:molybdopterin-dependent oxidoreductase n=1 Tax=Magnetovibrio sp. TaxID=2024836 RepID=UPI002F95B4BB
MANESMTLRAPSHDVVLSIEGKISNTNANTEPRADFDLAMLMAMPPLTIETSTPWTEGVVRFEGVAVKDVLDRVAPTGHEGEFVALNDYTVRIPLENFSQMNAIIAYRMNGKPMSVRDKGPLWVIYPLDTIKPAQSDLYRDRMVWQLRTIIVK